MDEAVELNSEGSGNIEFKNHRKINICFLTRPSKKRWQIDFIMIRGNSILRRRP